MSPELEHEDGHALDNNLYYCYNLDALIMKQKRDKNQKRNQLLDRLREGLKLMRECPICKQEFDENQVCFLEEKDPAHLVHLTCRECSSAVLAIMMFTPIGLSTIGIVTDLDPIDVVRLRKKERVSEDEVLDLHSLLQGSLEVQNFSFEEMIMR